MPKSVARECSRANVDGPERSVSKRSRPLKAASRAVATPPCPTKRTRTMPTTVPTMVPTPMFPTCRSTSHETSTPTPMTLCPFTILGLDLKIKLLDDFHASHTMLHSRSLLLKLSSLPRKKISDALRIDSHWLPPPHTMLRVQVPWRLNTRLSCLWHHAVHMRRR